MKYDLPKKPREYIADTHLLPEAEAPQERML
jgi:hypothetical protein